MLAMIFELLDCQGKDQPAIVESCIAACGLCRPTWRGLCRMPPSLLLFVSGSSRTFGQNFFQGRIRLAYGAF